MSRMLCRRTHKLTATYPIPLWGIRIQLARASIRRSRFVVSASLQTSRILARILARIRHPTPHRARIRHNATPTTHKHDAGAGRGAERPWGQERIRRKRVVSVLTVGKRESATFETPYCPPSCCALRCITRVAAPLHLVLLQARTQPGSECTQCVCRVSAIP